jgi:site-specific DNA recombinase
MSSATAAAAYLRVSTEEQTRGFSLGEQERLAVERAARDGHELPPERLYTDAGLSGKREQNRPAYQRLLADAAAGAFEVLYVWKLDRLGRDAEELLRARRMLDAAGVRIISLTEGEAESTLVYGVRALVAQEEREKISERVKSGKLAAARAGRANGGPRRFGFSQQDGQLIPRPDEVGVVERMLREAATGKAQSAIAADLNADGLRTAQGNRWSQQRVGQVLRDPIWVGRLRNAAGEFQISEPLVPLELFDAVQRMLHGPGAKRGRQTQRFLLGNGLLKCGRCGSSMRVKRERKDYGWYEVYFCEGRHSGATDCKQRTVARAPIDSAALRYFSEVALDVEGTIRQLAEEQDRRRAEVRGRLAQVRKALLAAEKEQYRLDDQIRSGVLEPGEWRRLSVKPQREAEAANLAERDLLAEQAALAEDVDVAAAKDAWIERITELRAAVAGEITEAVGIAAAQAAIRRVFTGFVLEPVRGANWWAQPWAHAEEGEIGDAVPTDAAEVPEYVLVPAPRDEMLVLTETGFGVRRVTLVPEGGSKAPAP